MKFESSVQPQQPSGLHNISDGFKSGGGPGDMKPLGSCDRVLELSPDLPSLRGNTIGEGHENGQELVTRGDYQTLTSSNGAEPKEMSDPANAPLNLHQYSGVRKVSQA